MVGFSCRWCFPLSWSSRSLSAFWLCSRFPTILFSQTIIGTCGILRARRINVRCLRSGGHSMHDLDSLAAFVEPSRADPAARFGAERHRMRPSHALSLALSALLAVSCSSVPLIGSLSPVAAQREAHGDIASGHMKIYIAGTRASGPVGVDSQDLALIRKLPRDQRLSKGCIDPDASAHIAYARAYNREIVRYLRGHRNTLKIAVVAKRT